MSRRGLSQPTRDRWFYISLAFSALLVAYLFSPYVYALLLAAVLVVVTWPLFERINQATGQRRALASVLTLLLLGLLVFAPLSVFFTLFLQELIAVVQQGIARVSEGSLQTWLWELTRYADSPPARFVEQYLGFLIPEDFDLIAAIAGPLQRGALSALNTASVWVPSAIESTVSAGLHTLMFLFAAATLYIDGPRLLQVLRNLSPMDDSYDARLFEVFREFARNIVVGSLATATIQGFVASIGYWLAGVDRVVFLGFVTAVLSFIPLLGAAGVGVLVGLGVWATAGWGPGMFVIGWSVLVTGLVDNLLKPMLLRGSSGIHPLLIFLAVFGGLAWMGIPGLLVGPVLVAAFLALYTIYIDEFIEDASGPLVDAPEVSPD